MNILGLLVNDIDNTMGWIGVNAFVGELGSTIHLKWCCHGLSNTFWHIEWT
jgi:hypothetical protein